MTLNNRDKKAVKLFQEGFSYAEIGTTLRISKSLVVQIIDKIIPEQRKGHPGEKNLKEALNSEALKIYIEAFPDDAGKLTDYDIKFIAVRKKCFDSKLWTMINSHWNCRRIVDRNCTKLGWNE
jgi:hypothetical protein